MNPDNIELAQLSAEQAADLRRLEQAASEEATEGADEAAQQEAQSQIDHGAMLTDEIAGMLLSVAAVLSPAFPSLGRIYTPEASKAAGAAVAGVCVKHGWLGGGLMGEYSEEITAAFILIPLAVATHQGVKGDINALKEKADKAAGKLPQQQAPAVVAGVASVPDVPSVPAVTIGKPVLE